MHKKRLFLNRIQDNLKIDPVSLSVAIVSLLPLGWQVKGWLQ